MEEFPSNARSRREPPREAEKPRVERIVTSPVTRRKKGFGRRMVESFVGGEPRSVGSFVMLDVLLPAMRDMIADGFTQMIEGVVYGESRSVGRRTGSRFSSGAMGRTNYHRMSTSRFDNRPDPRAPAMSQRGRAMHDFEDLVFPRLVEAQEILDRLFGIIQEFEFATIRDLYEMVGEKASHTDEKYGWSDISTARIERIREGYVLNLPRPEILR